MTFLTNTLGGPRPVLLFNKLNIKIVDSEFAYIAGAPYTLVFNDSNVEVVNSNFVGNRGARPYCFLTFPYYVPHCLVVSMPFPLVFNDFNVEVVNS